MVDRLPVRYYGYYMRRVELKVARIGNSRGVRLPATTLERYGIGDHVIMEERSDGILLRPGSSRRAKLSWEETADQMVTAAEDWSAWDAASADGLEDIPWDVARARRVADQKREYRARRRRDG